MAPSAEQAQEVESRSDFIEATVNYAIDTGEKVVNESYGPDAQLRRRSGGEKDEREVVIYDGRAGVDQFELEREGFVLVDHPTKMKDFWDRDELQAVYYPEVEQLFKQQTGCTAVHIFDFTTRSADEDKQENNFARQPVRGVHNDYTEWSGLERVRALLPADEAEALLEHRFAIVQAWRAIDKPIQSDPLAICDAQTLSPDDLIKVERRHPDRVGETYSIAYNPEHCWVYFSRNAPRRGAGVQGLRFRDRRPRPLDRPHLVHRPDHSAGRAAA